MLPRGHLISYWEEVNKWYLGGSGIWRMCYLNRPTYTGEALSFWYATLKKELERIETFEAWREEPVACTTS